MTAKGGGPEKDVFYYSNRCEWSRKALAMVEGVGKERFLFANVDNTQIPIPTGVDRVPCIVTRSMAILSERDLEKYLDRLSSIEPFVIQEMAGLSDTYSYIDTGTNLEHAYQYVSKPISTIATPTDDNERSRKVNVESFMEQRDRDLRSIVPPPPPPQES